jgi:hypothetical protein
VVLVQCDQDIAIGSAGRSARVIREVNTAVRNPQIIYDAFKLVSRNYLPDHLFNLVSDSSRLLDASSCLHPDVHIETAGIDRWEEIFLKKVFGLNGSLERGNGTVIHWDH